MFTSIAPRYDVLNHVLSFNIDRIWWRRTAKSFRHVLVRPESRVLDLCCGTGDMAFALQRQAENSARIVGADFSHAMLQRAVCKSASDGKTSPRWIEADALTLPFPDEHFDLVTSAFGFEKPGRYDAGLREICECSARVASAAFWISASQREFSRSTECISNKSYRELVCISGIKGPYRFCHPQLKDFRGRRRCCSA